MHSQFAGDGLDHAKGFVLGSLYEGIPGLDLRVDPMFSDAPLARGSAELNAYCRFLRIRPDRVINHEHQYRGLLRVARNDNREDYFGPHYGQQYDLFLDPDTGFGQGGPRHAPWRVLPELLPHGSPRVLAVFQSRRRIEDFHRQFVERHLPTYRHFWVVLGQQAYIVFLSSPDNRRLDRFRQVLSKAYRPYEARRIIKA